MKNEDIKSILIIGAAGGLAKITSGLLTRIYPSAKIIGVDPRSIGEIPAHENFHFKCMKYTRGNFEKLFREYKFDIVMHLGRMSHANANPLANLAERLDMSVMGTNRILDLSLKHAVKKVIILSTFHVYGALADNPAFITEDAALRASIKYPELRDVTEMDQVATNWMWRHQDEIETIVFRPCNVIGPQIQNTMTRYLTTPYAPLPIDYNPMFQFIHEYDFAHVLCESLTKVPTGIYNVAPDEFISLAETKEKIGVPSLKVPLFLLEPAAIAIKKLWAFPDYLLDYVKYPCLISSSALGKYLPKNRFRFTTEESLQLLKLD